MTRQELAALFEAETTKALGMVHPAGVFARKAFVRRMSRRLSAHFDIVGWPETDDEVLAEVRPAINRYC